jgi:hypothetical protein
LYLALFGIGFVVAVLLTGESARRVASHPMTRRMVRRDARIALWIFGAGLFFFGVRALGINPFSFGAPIWLWLCLLALVVAVAYFVVYARRVLPGQVEAFEQEQRKRRYLKPGRKAGALPPVVQGGKAARSR